MHVNRIIIIRRCARHIWIALMGMRQTTLKSNQTTLMVTCSFIIWIYITYYIYIYTVCAQYVTYIFAVTTYEHSGMDKVPDRSDKYKIPEGMNSFFFRSLSTFKPVQFMINIAIFDRPSYLRNRENWIWCVKYASPSHAQDCSV